MKIYSLSHREVSWVLPGFRSAEKSAENNEKNKGGRNSPVSPTAFSYIYIREL